jgi:hypothetical protein
MRTIASALVLLLTAAVPTHAQSNWFPPAIVERPDLIKALQSVDRRSSAIVDEWIRLVEIGAVAQRRPARNTSAQRCGSLDSRCPVDDMWNVSGVRKGSTAARWSSFARTRIRCFRGTELEGEAQRRYPSAQRR